jgi:FixJ family two-component response regulator
MNFGDERVIDRIVEGQIAKAVALAFDIVVAIVQAKRSL